MKAPLMRSIGIGIMLALTVFCSGAVSAHAQTAALSESQRRELLATLLDRLIDLLELRYPQIDWDDFRLTNDDDDNGDDEEDDDNDDEDEDEDEDENDDDDDSTASVGNNRAQATYELTIEFEAFGDDLFIEKSAVRSATVSGDDGITYVIQNGSGATYAGGSTNAIITSDDESGDTDDYFMIEEDETREFTLQVVLDNTGATEGFYRAKVVGVAYDDDASSGGETTTTGGFADEKTPAVFVDDTN